MIALPGARDLYKNRINIANHHIRIRLISSNNVLFRIRQQGVIGLIYRHRLNCWTPFDTKVDILLLLSIHSVDV